MSSLHNDLATWAGKARSRHEDTIELDVDTADKIAVLIAAAAQLVDRVEGIGGWGTCRNVDQERLKDAPEWVALYVASKTTR